MYEFIAHKEYAVYITEEHDEESDKIEEAKYDEALRWADAEEAKEAAELKEKALETVPLVPVLTEDEIWMKEQVAKGLTDDELGKDIVEAF